MESFADHIHDGTGRNVDAYVLSRTCISQKWLAYDGADLGFQWVAGQCGLLRILGAEGWHYEPEFQPTIPTGSIGMNRCLKTQRIKRCCLIDGRNIERVRGQTTSDG